MIDLTEGVRTGYQEILPICFLLYRLDNLLTLGSLAYTYQIFGELMDCASNSRKGVPVDCEIGSRDMGVYRSIRNRDVKGVFEF